MAPRIILSLNSPTRVKLDTYGLDPQDAPFSPKQILDLCDVEARWLVPHISRVEQDNTLYRTWLQALADFMSDLWPDEVTAEQFIACWVRQTRVKNGYRIGSYGADYPRQSAKNTWIEYTPGVQLEGLVDRLCFWDLDDSSLPFCEGPKIRFSLPRELMLQAGSVLAAVNLTYSSAEWRAGLTVIEDPLADSQHTGQGYLSH